MPNRDSGFYASLTKHTQLCEKMGNSSAEKITENPVRRVRGGFNQQKRRLYYENVKSVGKKRRSIVKNSWIETYNVNDNEECNSWNGRKVSSNNDQPDTEISLPSSLEFKFDQNRALAKAILKKIKNRKDTSHNGILKNLDLRGTHTDSNGDVKEERHKSVVHAKFKNHSLLPSKKVPYVIHSESEHPEVLQSIIGKQQPVVVQEKVDIFTKLVGSVAQRDKIIPNEENKSANETVSNTTNLSFLETPASLNTEQVKHSVENQKVDSVQFLVMQDYCMMLLKYPGKIYFQGKFNLSVVHGLIEVLGCELSDESGNQVVYSPRGNCCLAIESKPHEKKIDVQTLSSFGMNEAFLSNIDDRDGVLLLKPVNSVMTIFLEKHSSQILFKNKRCDMSCQFREAEIFLQTRFELYNDAMKLFSHDPSWDVISPLLLGKEQSRLMLCGGKGVGKSTMLRYFINKLIKKTGKVIVLDLDIGQSEFTVPSCISATIVDCPVVGPSYTHLKTPEKCLFIGEVNVAQCLERYVHNVQYLINSCKNIDSFLPVIINNMGITTGIGFDLMCTLIKIVQPTNLVQIIDTTGTKNYSKLLTPSNVDKNQSTFEIKDNDSPLEYAFHTVSSEVDSRSTGEWKIEPKKVRELTVLSYLSKMVNIDCLITAVNPYVVLLKDVKLIHISQNITSTAAVLNGNLVALCCIEEAPDSSKPYPVYECFGFGIVRGIDKSTCDDELYLITPEDYLEKITHLVMGVVETPSSVYMTSDKCVGLIPYVSHTSTIGTSKTPKRSFLSKVLGSHKQHKN